MPALFLSGLANSAPATHCISTVSRIHNVNILKQCDEALYFCKNFLCQILGRLWVESRYTKQVPNYQIIMINGYKIIKIKWK